MLVYHIFACLSIFYYKLLHIKAVGEQMPVCYQFVGWDVVDEFDVV